MWPECMSLLIIIIIIIIIIIKIIIAIIIINISVFFHKFFSSFCIVLYLSFINCVYIVLLLLLDTLLLPQHVIKHELTQ
jgi:hypothetical protein